MDEAASIPKKTTRTRKTASAQITSVQPDDQSIGSTSQSNVTGDFDELIGKIAKSKQEFDNLQKEIERVKQDWVREQRQHELELSQKKIQEELERKREQEIYDYQTALTRKRSEDEFQDKRFAWEKDLSQRKDELEIQKRELEELKKLTAGFDSQKEQAVREAQAELEKELKEKYENETKIREQEVKAEKEVLGLKISNLESENTRLIKELEMVKKSLDEATKQVKEIAVKVIESGSQLKNQLPSE